MNENLTKIEAAFARAEAAAVSVDQEIARTEASIARAQEAIDRFWEHQNAALARMREREQRERQQEEQPQVGALREAPLQEAPVQEAPRHPPVDPYLLQDLVCDLLQLTNRLLQFTDRISRRLKALERRTRGRVSIHAPMRERQKKRDPVGVQGPRKNKGM